MGDLVTESLIYSTEIGLMDTEQRRGVIMLIPKKDENRLILGNWRPISLLNTDYKIFTKTLAKRIQPFIPDIIHSDQTGFVKNRYMAVNIRTVQDTIKYLNIKGLLGILMSIDFEKAFDSIRWDFIIEALKTFNFGENFITWVRLIYTDIKACVINNGFTSEWFGLSKGTRQGCCLSPFLFIVAVELLAHNIRLNRYIEGIYVVRKEIKISQFADDTTCFLKTTQALEHMLDCIERFRRYAGLKINKYKSQYMAMGSFDEALLPNIQWSNHLTILGIVIGKDSTEYQNYLWNFKPRIDKIRNICLDWRNRNISLKGKVTIINSLIIPTVLYPATVIYTPQWVYTEVNKIITWFLWKSNHNRIAKATMCSPIDWGGLAVPDLESKVVVSNLNWIKRIFMDTNCLPSIFLELLLNKGVNIKDFISTKTELNVAQSDDLFYNKVLHD